jgi:hypothetical protein
MLGFPHSDRDKEPRDGQTGKRGHYRRQALHKNRPNYTDGRQIESSHHADRDKAVGDIYLWIGNANSRS